jgi:hypothetical protein
VLQGAPGHQFRQKRSLAARLATVRTKAAGERRFRCFRHLTGTTTPRRRVPTAPDPPWSGAGGVGTLRLGARKALDGLGLGEPLRVLRGPKSYHGPRPAAARAFERVLMSGLDVTGVLVGFAAGGDGDPDREDVVMFSLCVLLVVTAILVAELRLIAR